MRIAHLAFDQKFIPFAQDVFEEAWPDGNTWFLLHKRSKQFRFIRNPEKFNLVTGRILQTEKLLEKLNRHDLVVVHAMIPEFAGVVKRVSEELEIMWIGWGYEYYPYLERTFGDVILPETALAWQRAVAAESVAPKGAVFHLKAFLRPVYQGVKEAFRGQSSQETIQTVAGRIDLCCVSPSEMPLLKAAFPDFRARHYQLHYFSKEDILDRGPVRMTGPDILLGNSATPENNHIETMNLLRRMGVDGRKIITPLSYGRPYYAEEVCRTGVNLFGSDFMPLRKYLPIDEYHRLLATCGTVIMNHRRQAAMGNISAALYKGARVFLREENPIYETYTGLGARVDSMRAIEGAQSEVFVPLTEPERARNREIVGSYMSRTGLVKAIRGLAAQRKRGSSVPNADAEKAAVHG